MEDWPEPKNIIRKGNFPYIYKITKNFEYQTSWQLDKAFESKWLAISADGLLSVKANDSGYSWDGCTPKFSILNLWIIGVPDGHINYRTMKPYTYYASMVHDALYQYLDTVPVTKSQIDALFLEMLGDFKLKQVYYFFVCKFGGRR